MNCGPLTRSFQSDTGQAEPISARGAPFKRKNGLVTAMPRSFQFRSSRQSSTVIKLARFNAA